MKKNLVPWLAAAVVLLVHLAGNAHYGFFRDELYFITCGQHPQWGYVDQPPVVPMLAALSQLFGHSLFLLRLVPALFAAAGAYVTCLLVIEYGGGVFAQWFAAIVYALTPVLMNFGMKVSTDEINLFTWPLLALLILRIAKGANPRTWLLVGAVAGITIESKYSVIFFIVALGIGLLATRERRTMFTPWFAAGVALMLLISLPNFLWQAHYGYPMLELLQNGQHGKNLIAGPLLYLVQEIVITGVFLVPVWVIGLYALLRNAAHRFLGIAYIALIALMIVAHGKHYYPAAVYPILIAAGAVAIEAWTARIVLVRYAATTYALVLGAVFVPFGMPVLSEQTFLAYQRVLGATLHISKSTIATEHGRENSALPGDWADMRGWEELATTIKGVYDALPPAERAKAVVVASNYGEAAAVGFFTPEIPVISGHNQYWLWGTRGFDGSVIIDVNGDCGAHDHLFASSTRAAVSNPDWAVSYEQNVPIMLCRGLKIPISNVWPKVKMYI